MFENVISTPCRTRPRRKFQKSRLLSSPLDNSFLWCTLIAQSSQRTCNAAKITHVSFRPQKRALIRRCEQDRPVDGATLRTIVPSHLAIHVPNSTHLKSVAISSPPLIIHPPHLSGRPGRSPLKSCEPRLRSKAARRILHNASAPSLTNSRPLRVNVRHDRVVRRGAIVGFATDSLRPRHRAGITGVHSVCLTNYAFGQACDDWWPLEPRWLNLGAAVRRHVNLGW
jgi:hypothetical protein